MYSKLKGEKRMEELNIGIKNFTKILIGDKPGQGNACHEYYIGRAGAKDEVVPVGEFGHISFQNGPVKESGINGCHQEDILAIVIHRLQSFQKSEFVCRENALALTKCEEALHWLNHRTNERINRRVEGTTKI